MTGYWSLLPEVLLVAAAIVALFGEYLPGRDRGAALLGAAAAAAAAVLVAVAPLGRPLFGGVLAYDAIARYGRVAIPALTAIWLLWVAGRGTGAYRSREAVSLALFAAAGGMLLTSARDLVMFFMAVELSTMPVYVLVGYRRRDVAGLEGTLKYFLLSMLTSLVMLYGLSFVYGLTGSTSYPDVFLWGKGLLGTVAAVLVLTGLLAKLSAAPFHYWAPDAYAGAPAWSIAFVSTVPKIAGTIAAVRLVVALGPSEMTFGFVIAIAALASMILGNFAALPQEDVRRLMAYSGVAHTGYVLIGLAAGVMGPAGYREAVFYAVAYAVPSLGIMLVAAEAGTSLGDLHDLAVRRPWLAWSTVLFLLSLIGIPPLVGFFGKLSVFGAGLRAGLLWLVIAGVITSVVSAGYYFRIVRAMFLTGGRADSTEDDAAEVVASDVDHVAAAAPVRSFAASAAFVLLAVATLGMGIAASPLLASLASALH